MAGLRARLHPPAPSHSKKLQWHHAGVYRDLPLRAQLRIHTGFPYSIALIYVFLKALGLHYAVKKVPATLFKQIQHKAESFYSHVVWVRNV